MTDLFTLRAEFEQREAARSEREQRAIAVAAWCPTCDQQPVAAGSIGFTCPNGHVYRGAGLHQLECPTPDDCWC